jgi:hypothetical protein
MNSELKNRKQRRTVGINAGPVEGRVSTKHSFVSNPSNRDIWLTRGDCFSFLTGRTSAKPSVSLLYIYWRSPIFLSLCSKSLLPVVYRLLYQKLRNTRERTIKDDPLCTEFFCALPCVILNIARHRAQLLGVI